MLVPSMRIFNPTGTLVTPQDQFFGTTTPARDPNEAKIIDTLMNFAYPGTKTNSGGINKSIASGNGPGFAVSNRTTFYRTSVHVTDVGVLNPVIVPLDTGEFADDRKLALRRTPVPIPSIAVPEITASDRVHGGNNSDENITIYDDRVGSPTFGILFGFEKFRKAHHSPQVKGPTTGTLLQGGGVLAIGAYAYRVTACNNGDIARAAGKLGAGELGECDARAHQWDNVVISAVGQRVQLQWYDHEPYNSAVTNWRIYRAPMPAAGQALDGSSFKRIAEIPNVSVPNSDPKPNSGGIPNVSNVLTWVDDGTAVPINKPAPYGDSWNITAWTTEWRANAMGLMHDVADRDFHPIDVFDTDGTKLEGYLWDGSAIRVPSAANLITIQDVREFKAGTLPRDSNGDMYMPHSLAVGLNKAMSRADLWGYPGQSADGNSGTPGKAFVQARRQFLPWSLDYKADMAARATGRGTDPTTGSAFAVNDWTKCIANTMRIMGWYVADSLLSYLVFYCESKLMTKLYGEYPVGTSVDPSAVPDTYVYMDDTVPLTVAAKDRVQYRFNQLQLLPWDKTIIPIQSTCSNANVVCTAGGQETSDRTFDPADSQHADQFLGIRGYPLALHAGNRLCHWADNGHRSLSAGGWLTINGRASASSAPTMVYMTEDPDTADYICRWELKNFEPDLFYDIVPTGGFVFEATHRQIPGRRHYIGLGYNSASHAWVIRANTMTNPAQLNPSPLPLMTFEADLPYMPTQNVYVWTGVIGRNAFIMFDERPHPDLPIDPDSETGEHLSLAGYYGQPMIEHEIPPGFDAKGKAGAFAGTTGGNGTGVAIDAYWHWPAAPGTNPNQLKKVLGLSDGDTRRVVKLVPR